MKMKKILIIVIGLLIIGCSNSKSKKEEITKNYEKLENESLSTGIRKDSLYLGFAFGMSKNDLIKNF